jgi:hypothetical protein
MSAVFANDTFATEASAVLGVGGVLPNSASRSVDPSTELLLFYKKRCEEFEASQAETLQYLHDIEASHEELHKAKWELRVKREETAELQKELSDANVALFAEREQVLKLSAECEQLRIQELEDRRRIQHLLALSQPVTQEVTFFRDCRPSKMTRYPVGGGGATQAAGGFASAVRGGATATSPQAESLASGSGADIDASANDASVSGGVAEAWADNSGSSSGKQQQQQHGSVSFSATADVTTNTSAVSARSASRSRNHATGHRSSSNSSSSRSSSSSPTSVASGPPQQVLRTVYLPSEHADTLLMSVESLKAQLEEARRFHTDQVQALLHDRATITEQAAAEGSAAAEREARLNGALTDSERKLRTLTRDFLALRHASKVSHRSSKEEHEEMAAKLGKLRAFAARLQKEEEEEIAVVKEAAAMESEAFAEQFRFEAAAREEDITVLKEQYGALQSRYEERVRDLTTRLSRLVKRHRGLERRRNLEFEGFTKDVAGLRASLYEVEEVVRDAAVLQQGRGGGGGRGGAGREGARGEYLEAAGKGRKPRLSAAQRGRKAKARANQFSTPEELGLEVQRLREQLLDLRSYANE